MTNKEITLTVLEIEDLARAAGLRLEAHEPSELDDMEIEYTIIERAEGIEIFEDDVSSSRYNHAAFITDDPGEGTFPLGSPLGEGEK